MYAVSAASNSIHSDFVLSGCERPDGGFVDTGMCSGDGKYYCTNLDILQNTIDVAGACGATTPDCCPSG